MALWGSIVHFRSPATYSAPVISSKGLKICKRTTTTVTHIIRLGAKLGNRAGNPPRNVTNFMAQGSTDSYKYSRVTERLESHSANHIRCGALRHCGVRLCSLLYQVAPPPSSPLIMLWSDWTKVARCDTRVVTRCVAACVLAVDAPISL